MKVAKLDARTVARLKLPPGKLDEFFWDQSMRGFGLRLDARRGQLRRTFVALYRHGGRTVRYPIGSADVLSAEAARSQAKKILGKPALGQDPAAERTSRRAREAITFTAIASDYLAAKRGTVRKRTFVESQRYLTGPYFKVLHSMPVDDIGRKDIAARLLAI